MKTQNIETLLPKIVPLLPGCNDDIAIISLADAARTFARESDIIIETKSYDENDAPSYGRIPEFAEDPENFLPHHFINYEKDPNNKRIYVTYSLLPTARLFPAAILARHYEAIIEYSMFLLCNMPGKPWTNTDLANFHYQKYRAALGDAIRDNSTNGAVFDQSIVLADDYGYQGGLNVTIAGNGTDTSDATATAEQLVYPATAYVKGEKITGKIRNVTASISDNVVTVPQGNIANKQTLTVAEMAEPTVTANVVTIGKGYNKTQKSVTIPEAGELSVSGNVVTVPVGYIKTQRSATVAEAAAPTTSGNVVTVNKGYQSAEKKITVGTAKAAATITPGTSDQMVSSGTYLTGNLTVKGDSKLIAANIKEGETIFGIVGTHKGGNDIDISGVTVTADKMLSGVIAIGKNGETITGNIQNVTPSVNKNTFSVGKGYVETAFTETIAESGASTISGNKVTVPAGYLSADRVETIPEAGELSVSGNVVTVPVGYIKSERTAAIPEATVTETDSSVTITPGYVAEELNYDLGSGGGGSVDLSFVTAGEHQIIKGYVGADKNGNPVYGTYDLEWGTGGDGILRVATWHPPQPACTGLSKIVVSGLGTFGSEEDGDFGDYSSANGTYEVTEKTERIAAPFERIYKHTSGEWYIWGEYDSEYEEGYWYIGPAPDSGNLVYWSTGALTDGTFTFEDWDWGYSFDVTLDVTETSYEASGEYVSGVNKSNYFIECNGYEVIPQVGRLYEYMSYSDGSNRLVSRALDIGNGVYGEGLVLLSRWGRTTRNSQYYIDETGICEIGRSSKFYFEPETDRTDSLFGNPLVWFRWLASDECHLTLKNLPETHEFTIEYWEKNLSNSDAAWGGPVLINKTCLNNLEHWSQAYIVSAEEYSENIIRNQWFHRALVYDGNYSPSTGKRYIREYINGVEIALHDYHGDVYFDEETGLVKYKESHNIFGDDEYIFTPGCSPGGASVAQIDKYVAQLAIWNRALSADEVANIALYKQPYNL